MSNWWLLGSAALLAATAQAGTEFYVAPTGSDAAPGTVAQPFATVARAQQAVRAAHADGATVFLRGGTHYLAQPLVFTAADPPTTYAAYAGETPVLSGGTRLDGLAWRPYRDGIMQTTVPAELATDQLFVNGERQHLARYPNFDAHERHFNGYAKDAFSRERAARWAHPEGGFMHTMHSSEWGGMHYRITGKDAAGNLTYEGGWQNNRPAGMHREFRMVEGIFEELDAPGEWFLDRASHTLYYYPPTGLDLTKALVEVVRLPHLVEWRGTQAAPVKGVNLRGLTVRHTARTFMDNREPLLRSDWTTYRGGALFFDGAEDCAVEDCCLDQLGGNGVYVNNYNRRVTVRGCRITQAGANGVAFCGDPAALRNAIYWKDKPTLAGIDLTPGPRTDNYPADCLVEECLIERSGRVEKQTAPVAIDLARRITVRHCSLYDVPRAGINIGEGAWGGHVIEFCDVFDTVKETGDHGSFNSWGRDRFWGLGGVDLNNVRTGAQKELPLLDVVEPIILRNSRWRCDHGWDIDLDDGSSRYEIRNNLCLNGGLKNREGYCRIVENNIIINNGFHPHVWYTVSDDLVRRNIMMSDGYLPAGGMPAGAWGAEMDYNLVHHPGQTERLPAETLARQSKRDAHSISVDVQFVNPETGDFRVKDGSPALALGFVNFPMDQFGVTRPELKKLARTPELPTLGVRVRGGHATPTVEEPVERVAFGAVVRNIKGLGDRSAYGLPDESGVLVLRVPAGSEAAKAGLQAEDVLLGINGQTVKTVADLTAARDKAAGAPLRLDVRRKQQEPPAMALTDYLYVTTEAADTAAGFQQVPLGGGLPATVSTSGPTLNDPRGVLVDGALTRGYGPVFGNGSTGGRYRLDLGATKVVVRVDSYSHSLGARGRQRFTLCGAVGDDPGFDPRDARWTPLLEVDTLKSSAAAFTATSIRRAGGQPVGSFRWLLWAVQPATSVAGGEHTAWQELQVR